MRSKNASLIISPRTGENVAKLPDILAILAAAGWKTNISLKEYGKHVMTLANDASEDKQDLIIAYGGDGTLNQVVNGVMSAQGKKRHSVVAIVPGGTANVWATEIGVPIDPVKAALTLVDSEERKVDVGRLEVQSITFPGEEPIQISGKIKKKATQESKKVRHHFLMMAGLGIDAAIMGNVSKPLKYHIGPLAVGLSAAKELPSQHPFSIEIQAVGENQANQPLWKGKTLQVVIGNTRRYAKVTEMTPDAYIDDGILDVCVITAGNPLSTMQQLSSLLLRLRPDNTTAEYFHGAHLLITVPATVPFHVDGSPVKLKDYLNKSDYVKLQQIEDQSQVLVTYQFDAVPHALEVAIPRTYNDELFEHTAGEQHTDQGRSPVKVHPLSKEDEEAEKAQQEHTVAVLTQSRPEDAEKEESAKEPIAESSSAAAAELESLLKEGRKITVVGKTPNPAKKHTYIIAGGSLKEATGEIVPVAVVVNAKTVIYHHDGQRVTDSEIAIKGLEEGSVIIVEGSRSKRSVIEATRLIM